MHWRGMRSMGEWTFWRQVCALPIRPIIVLCQPLIKMRAGCTVSGRRRRLTHKPAARLLALLGSSIPLVCLSKAESERATAVCDASLFSAALSSRINNSADRTVIFANICSHWNVNQNRTHLLLTASFVKPTYENSHKIRKEAVLFETQSVCW